jgi:hypothetical protein
MAMTAALHDCRIAPQVEFASPTLSFKRFSNSSRSIRAVCHNAEEINNP